MIRWWQHDQQWVKFRLCYRKIRSLVPEWNYLLFIIRCLVVRRGKINSFFIGLQTFVSFLLLVMLLEKCRAHERLRDTGASNETHCSCALSEDEWLYSFQEQYRSNDSWAINDQQCAMLKSNCQRNQSSPKSLRDI